MTINLNGINYIDQFTSNSKLISYVIESAHQTYPFIMQDDIVKQFYNLSSRNTGGAYNIPTNQDRVYINFIPKKVFVSDSNLKDYIDTSFSYFVEPLVVLPDLFNLPEGQIFRCFDNNALPLPKEDYTYWIIEDGKKRKIKNYKTLEVMMAQRGISLLSVRVIPESQCEQIGESVDQIPDKTSSWTEDYIDQTNFEKLKALDAAVKSGQALADGAKASANQQIDAVKAQAAADKASADAAKADAVASKAASDAAIAQAQAAQAQADAAKAAFEAQTKS